MRGQFFPGSKLYHVSKPV